jgi:hypothetical protein
VSEESQERRKSQIKGLFKKGNSGHHFKDSNGRHLDFTALLCSSDQQKHLSSIKLVEETPELGDPTNLQLTKPFRAQKRSPLVARGSSSGKENHIFKSVQPIYSPRPVCEFDSEVHQRTKAKMHKW